jgi:hypothetical protein
MLCPEMEFIGWVAIRMGYCRNKKCGFALIPDFLIPRRRISRLGHQLLKHYYQRNGQDLQCAIDDWLEGLGDEFYLPRSSAAFAIRYSIRPPPE